MTGRTCELYYREGNADKVYTVCLVAHSLAAWRVLARWGRRGTQMQEMFKCSPCSYSAATLAYLRLIEEKKRKGYREAMPARPPNDVEQAAQAYRDAAVGKITNAQLKATLAELTKTADAATALAEVQRRERAAAAAADTANALAETGRIIARMQQRQRSVPAVPSKPPVPDLKPKRKISFD